MDPGFVLGVRRVRVTFERAIEPKGTRGSQPPKSTSTPKSNGVHDHLLEIRGALPDGLGC